ncbi:MAG: aldehyde dehydrogenase family protein, partial [Candidatus Thalassarchaeaceae archaeon]|nr:aldehyde dehydrogenase family protein [Candidatus Thalassarchaeaceae archaeon]
MRVLNYIQGKFVEPSSENWMENTSPSTGEIIGSLPLSGDVDVGSAVDAARNALPGWSALEPSERADWLDRIADCLESKHEEIAYLESLDTGKPIALSRSVDANRSVSNFRFFSGMIREQEDEMFEMSDATNIVSLRAVGVGALITPWNLPLYLLSWKVAPAIGMGNTVVCKPSELTPLTADLLMRVVDEVGLPPGVVNLIHGNGIAGSSLTSNPEVDLVSFTGGTSTGAKVASAASPQFKKVSLELGGKNASIVFSDCDLEKTVEGVTRAAFLNQGQVCLCGSRILIE